MFNINVYFKISRDQGSSCFLRVPTSADLVHVNINPSPVALIVAAVEVSVQARQGQGTPRASGIGNAVVIARGRADLISAISSCAVIQQPLVGRGRPIVPDLVDILQTSSLSWIGGVPGSRANDITDEPELFIL